MVERSLTEDLMPNVPISCLPPNSVDPKVQGLKVIIDCPQPGSSWATNRPSPISRWSKCGGNDMITLPNVNIDLNKVCIELPHIHKVGFCLTGPFFLELRQTRPFPGQKYTGELLWLYFLQAGFISDEFNCQPSRIEIFHLTISTEQLSKIVMLGKHVAWTEAACYLWCGWAVVMSSDSLHLWKERLLWTLLLKKHFLRVLEH